jgi:hypothetical protein
MRKMADALDASGLGRRDLPLATASRARGDRQLMNDRDLDDGEGVSRASRPPSGSVDAHGARRRRGESSGRFPRGSARPSSRNRKS